MSTSPKEIQDKLRSHFSLKTLEYKAPYKGKQGEHPAEIYFPGMGLMQQMELLKFFDNEKANIISGNLGMRGGCAQIIIKTETLREAFEKYAMSLLSLIERADRLLPKGKTPSPLEKAFQALALQKQSEPTATATGGATAVTQVFSSAAVAVTISPAAAKKAAAEQTATATANAPVETAAAANEATAPDTAAAPAKKII